MDNPASSPFPLAPISASILAEQEADRRNTLRQLGPFKSGCPEIDDYILQGGLERGSVVGLSAEEESFGLTLGLQILSRALCEDSTRVFVITPKPAAVLLRLLRDSLRVQLRDEKRVKACLDRVMLSCVFDMDGLWEVLSDLDRRAGSSPLRRQDSREIQDSEDEGSPLSTPHADKPSEPSLILITHFSTLLTSLFTQRAKDSAHTNLHLLSSHMRHLTRNLASNPLILILNSTTSPTDSTTTQTQSTRPLDASLRSVFNTAPLPIPGYVPSNTRRNKPSFGMVFAQLLDLHMLASRVARTRDDEEGYYLGKTSRGEGRFVTVVEVLLDEMGLWTGKLGTRPCREQRWGPVDVEGGKVVDAFGKVVDGTYISWGFGRRP